MGGATMGAAAAAHAYAMAGHTGEARRRLLELEKTTGRYVQPYGLALVCTALGEHDRALHWLEQAYRDRSFWWVFWGNVDPRMDPLRGDARFQNLVRRLNLTP
jgi:hypothetical protein